MEYGMCIMLLRRYIHIRWLEVIIVFVVGWGCCVCFFFFLVQLYVGKIYSAFLLT